MLNAGITAIRAAFGALLVFATLAGCASPSSSAPNMPKAIGAVTTAMTQAQAQDPATGTNPYTQTYTSPDGGTAVLSFQACQSYNTVGPVGTSPAGWGTWGTLTFSSYVDGGSGNTINGTLQLVVLQTGGTTPGGTVTWSGFTGLVDVTGTLQFSGGIDGNMACDFLASFNGSSIALSGTVSNGGTFFDVSNGQMTAAPTPTVAFSPLSQAGYSPGDPAALGVPLVMTSAGSTIYYTTDVSTPVAGAGSTVQYGGQIISPSSPSTFYGIAIAYAVKGGVPSRLSLVVYPSAG